ncbi:MAG TPA: hypothetical protein VHQ41_00835 [Patescibacteria group bacterium]|nr:hypothetical protein [Patescibacteria group bacterium]
MEEGEYRPFADPNEGILGLNLIPGGTDIRLSNHKSSIELFKDDSFKLDESGRLIRLPGPYFYTNGFRKVIAESRLSQDKLITQGYQSTESLSIYHPFTALAFKDGVGEAYFRQTDHQEDTVDETWDIVILSKTKEKPFYSIRVRPWARKPAGQWLRKKLERKGLLKRRSGMFDYYQTKRYGNVIQTFATDESDESYRLWMERELEIIQPQNDSVLA